jgi:hypothetical protein
MVAVGLLGTVAVGGFAFPQHMPMPPSDLKDLDISLETATSAFNRYFPDVDLSNLTVPKFNAPNFTMPNFAEIFKSFTAGPRS